MKILKIPLPSIYLVICNLLLSLTLSLSLFVSLTLQQNILLLENKNTFYL